jgi:hypothetical protein
MSGRDSRWQPGPVAPGRGFAEHLAVTFELRNVRDQPPPAE